MINLFRKNQRVLMLIVAVLTIIAFIFLYNTVQLDELASVRNPTIYGKPLTPVAIDRQVKNYQLTVALGQFDLLQKLGGMGMDREAAANEYVWNLLVLQHEARNLGVQPTDDQVASRIESLPVFQTSGQFDPAKYSTFLRDQLAPRGFTERQLEEVMRDSLRVDRIARIVEAPVSVSEAELREAARILQPVSGAILRFDAAAATSGVTVTPEEIKDYFDRNQAQLNTEETRSVRYVVFELPPGPAPEGREKVESLQKLADAASRFVDQLAQPGASFDSAAAAAGTTVRDFASLDRTGALPAAAQVGGEEAKKLADLAREIAPAIFLLSQAGATTDVVQRGDTFVVAQLSGINPARPLTIDEATPQIEVRLRTLAAQSTLENYITEKLQAVRQAVGSGKSIADAAAEAGLKIETFENLSPTSETLTPEQRTAVGQTFTLRDGEISPATENPEGPMAVFLASRGALDEKAFEERRAEFRDGLLENKRNLLFVEWLRTAREAARLTFPGNPRG
ncbi:MAG: SurA N-terminal domain-containing protein [Terrimicrobiaceae bacterium]|nr:SurA N-terminal domain-containing protein [Terrimicrobiaceae bacterium]